MQAERRAPRGDHTAGEIIRGIARRGDDQQLLRHGHALDEAAGGVKPVGGASGSRHLEHSSQSYPTRPEKLDRISPEEAFQCGLENARGADVQAKKSDTAKLTSGNASGATSPPAPRCVTSA